MYCPECGKRVAATAKFCRYCGASQQEELPSDIHEPMLHPGTHACASCGNPLDPGEKFCGTCGAKKGEPFLQDPLVTAPLPTPSPPPTPAPVLSRSLSCRGCGLPLSPGIRFCGECGEAVSEIPVAAPAPVHDSVVSPLPPVFTPPPPQSSQIAGPRLCRVCGNIINPHDKFCKKCLAKVVEGPGIPRTPYEAPAPVVSRHPPPSEPPSSDTTPSSHVPKNRLCRSCGYIISPGDKFCKKCLARVAEVIPVSPVPADLPGTPVPSPTASFPVCASCGSPITEKEKFCGICGTAIQSVTPSPPETSSLEKMTCARCGSVVSATTKFCGECGTPVGTMPTPGVTASAAGMLSPVVTGTPPVSAEEVTGVIGNARKMKMPGASWDTYTIVVTNRRMILAQMTQALLNASIMEARSKATTEGKGFLAIMKDQMAAQFRFALRYETMPPDTSLAETPGNFALENSGISAITMKLMDSDSGETEYTEFRITIESSRGKFEYLIAEDDRFIDLLKTVYGEKVRMPFGYFRAGGVRLKFF